VVLTFYFCLFNLSTTSQHSTSISKLFFRLFFLFSQISVFLFCYFFVFVIVACKVTLLAIFSRWILLKNAPLTRLEKGMEAFSGMQKIQVSHDRKHYGFIFVCGVFLEVASAQVIVTMNQHSRFFMLFRFFSHQNRSFESQRRTG